MECPTETKRREIIMDKHYLPPEVWTLVLARLPARTLLRMRCVCKSWLCIIDDPDFASLHLSLFNTTLNRPRYLTLESERDRFIEKPTQHLHIRHFNVHKKGKFRKSTTIPIPGKFQVIGCAKGLMLIKRSQPQSRSHQLELWNPSTRNSFVIPTPPFQRRNGGWQFAFGFDPSSGSTDCDRDVKVVAMPLLGSDKTLAIYSLQSKSWRTKQMNMDLESCKLYMKWKPLFYGGALHWLARHDGYYLGWTLAELCPTHLCSFHLGSEEFELVELPNFEEDYPGEAAHRFSCLLGESLAIFGITESRRCIWVMQKDGDRVSWTTKWYSIDPTPSKVQHYFKRTLWFMLLFIEDTNTLLWMSTDRSVTSYNLVSHRIQSLTTYSGRVSIRLVNPYVESLVLHKKFDSCVDCTSSELKQNVLLN